MERCWVTVDSVSCIAAGGLVRIRIKKMRVGIGVVSVEGSFDLTANSFVTMGTRGPTRKRKQKQKTVQCEVVECRHVCRIRSLFLVDQPPKVTHTRTTKCDSRSTKIFFSIYEFGFPCSPYGNYEIDLPKYEINLLRN